MDISKTWIPINCPKCNYSFEIQLEEARLETVVCCHNCKSDIRLVDGDASTSRGIKEIEDAFEDLNNSLKNLFK